MARTVFGFVLAAPLQYPRSPEDWKELQRFSFRLHLGGDWSSISPARYIREIPKVGLPSAFAGHRVQVTIEDDPRYGQIYVQELHLDYNHATGVGYVLKGGRRWMVLHLEQFHEELLRFLAAEV